MVSRKLPELIDQFQGRIVVGHTLAFDFRFLTYETERLGHEGIDIRFADTLGLARRLIPTRDDHRLGSLLSALEVAPDADLHTAVCDAYCSPSPAAASV